MKRQSILNNIDVDLNHLEPKLKETVENDRKKRRKKKRKGNSKNSRIKIDRKEDCKVDPSELPADAQFKGYQTTIVQGLKIETDNVL
ncbi:MAG: hypothetical protein KAR32_03615, partial [Candidatus Omnitrophica bacterium]|nr:hypothetical protein [Candidatus Omnitrophota bacterium]